MLTSFPRSRSFSCIAVCGLISFAAFTAIAVSLISLKIRAQSATPSPYQTSQPVPAWQREAGGKMEFEVASIRPAAPGTHPHFNGAYGIESSSAPPGGRFSTVAPLSFYILYAYRLMLLAGPQYDAVFGHLPKWITTESFDIEAKSPMIVATPDLTRLMMQSLLADRFKLAVHFATHDVPVMALVLVKPGKLGPQLRPHAEGPPCDANIPPVDRNSPKIPDVFMPVCDLTNLQDWTNHTFILGARHTTMTYSPLMFLR